MKGLFDKIYNWIVSVWLAYQDAKNSKMKYRKCHYCGKRYWFDVSAIPKEVQESEITFICQNCNEVYEKPMSFKEVSAEEMKIIFDNYETKN
jgi:hypothetical protein